MVESGGSTNSQRREREFGVVMVESGSSTNSQRREREFGVVMVVVALITEGEREREQCLRDTYTFATMYIDTEREVSDLLTHSLLSVCVCVCVLQTDASVFTRTHTQHR